MKQANEAGDAQFRRALAGRYELEGLLGRGGMGVVYLARDLRLERPVALKVPPPDRAADPAFRARFLREARTAAALAHPNIVPIFAVHEVGEYIFFAMAYLGGETLARRIAHEGPLSSLAGPPRSLAPPRPPPAPRPQRPARRRATLPAPPPADHTSRSAAAARAGGRALSREASCRSVPGRRGAGTGARRSAAGPGGAADRRARVPDPQRAPRGPGPDVRGVHRVGRRPRGGVVLAVRRCARARPRRRCRPRGRPAAAPRGGVGAGAPPARGRPRLGRPHRRPCSLA